GLTQAHDGDKALAQDLLDRMAANSADFTLTFRRLGDAVDGDPAASAAVRSLFDDPTAFDAWTAPWRQRLAREGRTAAQCRDDMRVANPAFIPRNHRIEAVIVAAQDNGDFAPLEELVTVLATPYDDQPPFARYTQPPEPHEVVQQTFCGT